MKLLGKKLTVVSIHRKGIFDMDAMAFCCDNCGRMIINSAVVSDETGKQYVIGLDCKKTLIDKSVIEAIEATGEYDTKYKIKDYKSAQSTITKVLAFLDNPNVEITASNRDNWLNVKDMTKTNQLGMNGLIVYGESLSYLFSIGLKDILQSAVNKRIIKPY